MDFELFRPRLRALVCLLVGPKMKGRIDESSVVQKTLLDAFLAKDQCRALTEAQQYAWLKQILKNNLLDAIRKAERTPADEGEFEATTRRITDWIPDPGRSPSGEAAWQEDVDWLTDAVARLPEAQRTALEFVRLCEYSLSETARRMGKTYGAVASLVVRAERSIRKMKGNGHP